MKFAPVLEGGRIYALTDPQSKQLGKVIALDNSTGGRGVAKALFTAYEKAEIKVRLCQGLAGASFPLLPFLLTFALIIAYYRTRNSLGLTYRCLFVQSMSAHA